MSSWRKFKRDSSGLTIDPVSQDTPLEHSWPGGYALHAQTNGTGWAGYFWGKVHVNGTLSKSAGSFLIDHPDDPANKFLVHSFVESPDMMNVYNGIVTLDAAGERWVELPAYFPKLNTDPRYQLTAIGSPASLYTKREYSTSDNRVLIAGGKAGQRVSWQITGVRNDPYAQANRIVPERTKSAEERGRYLQPELYNQPEALRLHAGPAPLAPAVTDSASRMVASPFRENAAP